MSSAHAAGGDCGELLCLILDLNALAWSLAATGEDPLSLEQALAQTLIFCNAHLALRHENELAVFSAGAGKSKLLYSSSLVPSPQAKSSISSNTYQQFSTVDDRITEGVRQVMADLAEDVESVKSGLVGALAIALCHINRLNAVHQISTALVEPKPRIVILSVTEDESSQYVAIMNCIFSAQKASIPIDVCKVYGPDAVFLQQACHLTSGSYYRLARRAGLLQYLLMAFLPGSFARKYLTAPTQEQVDLRAACFCHRKIVDIGYVCSVCLSIFCSPIPVCSTCRTKFPMSTLMRLGAGAKATSSSVIARPPRKRKAVDAVAPGVASPVVSGI